jgi:hypothetical protein
MHRAEDIRRLLVGRFTDLGVAAVTFPEGDGLDQIDPREVWVSPVTGGLGLQVEGAITRPTAQIISRDEPEGAAEALAYAIDTAIIDAAWPLDIGPEERPVWIFDAGRVGGDPGYIAINTRGWVTFSCNYWFTEER